MPRFISGTARAWLCTIMQVRRSHRFVPSFLIWLLAVVFTEGQNAAVVVNVDAAGNRHPINPNVYGVAHATSAQLSDLNTPLDRNGGNNTTRYNWQLNADNRANDWFYESIADPSAVAGERGDTFFSNARAANAQAMLTIPMIGWIAKAGPGRSKLASFSIAKYGAQTGNDWQWFPDAGNGVGSNGQFISGNDPNDASVPSDSALQQAWVQHLVSRWGTNATGGLRYYILDNEPSIWHGTHRDVHPTGATMDEVKNRIVDYVSKIKAIDPSALVVGPEEWGWSGYFFSGFDQQYGAAHGWSALPDRTAHAGADYLPWLLDQLRQSGAAAGTRLLDVFTVHYYPQGGEFSTDVSTAMQLRRNRSTRSLWDPAYVDETWINDRVQLVPRLKTWTRTYYPGTATGITEYNWGAEDHINGATAQADILGIFGREGLDMAARWATPAASTPTYKAMKMYRNYDGAKSTFGETSVAAAAPDPDTLSAFAAQRAADGALTVMLINKALSGATAATINLSNFSAGVAAQLWQLTPANSITRLADVAVGRSSFSLTLPPQSVTLLVIPSSGPSAPKAPTNLRIVR
jgi:Glycoside hydrolase family 44